MSFCPIATAKEIFQESLGAMMAHSLRGVQNYFERQQITLNLNILADSQNLLNLSSPGISSILRSRLTQTGPWSPDVLQATIFIHRYANRTLARVVIAHEIFHLLLELNAYLESGRNQWMPVKVTKAIEDQCNQFAWELCKTHDLFNNTKSACENYILFPKNFFEHPLTTNAQHQAQWPSGMALDERNAFTKPIQFPPPF